MEFILNLFIKSSLILLLTGLFLPVLKSTSATLRHWLISLVMIGLLCLPFLMIFIPTIELEAPILVSQEEAVKIEQQLPFKGAIAKDKITVVEPNPIINKEKNIAPNSDEIADNELIIKENAVSNPLVLPFTLTQFIWSIWLLGFSVSLLKFFLGIYGVWK